MRLDAESRKRVRMTVWGLVLSLVMVIVAACSQETWEDEWERNLSEERAHFVRVAAEHCGGEPDDYEFGSFHEHPYEENARIAWVDRRSDDERQVISWWVVSSAKNYQHAHQAGRLLDYWCDVENPSSPGQADG